MLVGHLQFVFELVSGVEVIFNGPFTAASDKNHVAYAGRIGFFYRVLNQRLVHHRQHFLGLGFGGGQKACAQSGNRENCFGECEFLHGVFVDRKHQVLRKGASGRVRLQPECVAATFIKPGA